MTEPSCVLNSEIGRCSMVAWCVRSEFWFRKVRGAVKDGKELSLLEKAAVLEDMFFW